MSSLFKKLSHLMSAIVLVVVILPLTGCDDKDPPPPAPAKPTVTVNIPAPVVNDVVLFRVEAIPTDANTPVTDVFLNIDAANVARGIRQLQTRFPMTQEGSTNFWSFQWTADRSGDFTYFVEVEDADGIRQSDPATLSVQTDDDGDGDTDGDGDGDTDGDGDGDTDGDGDGDTDGDGDGDTDGDGDGDTDGDGDGDTDGDGDGDTDGDGDGDTDGDGDGDTDGDGDGDTDGDGDGDTDGDGDGDTDGDGDGDTDGDGDGDTDGDGDGDTDGDGDGDTDGDGDGDTDGDGDGDTDGDGDGDTDGDGDGDTDGDGDGDTDGDGDGDTDGDGDGDTDGDGDGDTDGDGDGDTDGDGDGDTDGDGDGDTDGDGDGDTDGDGDGDTDGDGDGDTDELFVTPKNLVAAIFFTLPDGSFIQKKGDDETTPICVLEPSALSAAVALMRDDQINRVPRAEQQFTANGLQGGLLTLTLVANDQGALTKVIFDYDNLKGGVDLTPYELDRVENDQILNGRLTWWFDEWAIPEGGTDPVAVLYRHEYTNYNSRSIAEPKTNDETIQGTISFNAKPAGTAVTTSTTNTRVTHNLTGRYIQHTDLVRVTDGAAQTQSISGKICVHDSSVETCATLSTPIPLIHACNNLADATAGGPMLLDLENSVVNYEFAPVASNEFQLGIDQDGDEIFELNEVYNWFKPLPASPAPTGN